MMLLAMCGLVAALAVSPLVHTLPPLLEAKLWALETLGWTQYTCLANIVERESGWRVTARNRTSSAYGLGQALPASKMARFGADYLTNPTTQLRFVMSYGERRYGSMCEAWAWWKEHRWW